MSEVKLDERLRLLAVPFKRDEYQWRPDGKPREFGEGKHFMRYVAYITAPMVQARLDEQFPGQWDLKTKLVSETVKDGGVANAVYHARITIEHDAGIIVREDVGEGESHKAAATDAFKRCATRFGIGLEMYEFGQNWVPVGEGKYPKPKADPGKWFWARVDKRALGRHDDGQDGVDQSGPSDY